MSRGPSKLMNLIGELIDNGTPGLIRADECYVKIDGTKWSGVMCCGGLNVLAISVRYFNTTHPSEAQRQTIRRALRSVLKLRGMGEKNILGSWKYSQIDGQSAAIEYRKDVCG